MWGRFIDAFTRWSRRFRVSAIVIQEHNLHPSREADIVRQCMEMGVTATVGFAPAGPDGVHRGGVMLLTFDAEITVKRVIEREGDLVRVACEVGGRAYDVAGTYVPSNGLKRVDMLNRLTARLGPDTIVGGDWNCVPDVTLDVKSPRPLEYANVGAELLAQVMDTHNLLDIHREPLSIEDGFC